MGSMAERFAAVAAVEAEPVAPEEFWDDEPKRKRKNNRKAPGKWLRKRKARCERCNRRAPRLPLHHVVYRQHVEKEGGDVWDPRNAMTLCDDCHDAHHDRVAIIPTSALPRSAVQFAVELMGQDRARIYLARYYGGR
jgi:hypothetical protein